MENDNYYIKTIMLALNIHHYF